MKIKADIKTLNDLTLLDRFLFAEAMDDPLINQLKNCYIIMIGPFDILKRGSYQYTFQMRCDEYPEICLEDGGYRIFLNTRGHDKNSASPELIELLHYIETVTGFEQPHIAGDKLKRLHGRVQTIRASEEIGVKWMQLWEEKLREQMEARAEGKAEGKAEGEMLSVIRQIRKKVIKNMEPEAIADALEDEVEKILPFYEVIKDNPDLSDEEIYQMLHTSVSL